VPEIHLFYILVFLNTIQSFYNSNCIFNCIYTFIISTLNFLVIL